MRSFLTNTLLFMSIFIGIVVLIETVSSAIIRKKADFNLSLNPKYIVVGHSHPECAFNDSLISNFKNIAESAEAYFYTYFKTKEIIKHNPSIKVVFIEFTNNQINESANSWLWDNEYISYRYAQYSSFMGRTDEILLFKNNTNGYPSLFSLSMKKNLGRVLKSNYNFSEDIGGYQYLALSKTDSLIKSASKTDTKQLNKELSISEHNLYYLSKLIDYCISKGEKVLLVRSPMHQQYEGFANEALFLKILNERYAKIDFLDFSKFPLSNESYFDLDHLNYKGAKVFSTFFAELLDNGLMDKDNKQLFIDFKMKALEQNADSVKQ